MSDWQYIRCPACGGSGKTWGRPEKERRRPGPGDRFKAGSRILTYAEVVESGRKMRAHIDRMIRIAALEAAGFRVKKEGE